MSDALYWAVFSGVSLISGAYLAVQSTDEAWDGRDQSTVEIAAASLNETGLTDDPGYWDGDGFWHYENEV